MSGLDHGPAPHEAPTVPPPPSACCPRCGGVLITLPCGCDPVPTARRAYATLRGAVARMTLGELRAFTAWVARWGSATAARD